MSGALNAPLLAPDQASKVLDEVIYERVLELIDVEGLSMFEQELWWALGVAGYEADKAAVVVKDMIDRALDRFCEDPRRYLTMRANLGDCPLCEEAAQRTAAEVTKRNAG